jgi:hypothetical protein
MLMRWVYSFDFFNLLVELQLFLIGMIFLVPLHRSHQLFASENLPASSKISAVLWQHYNLQVTPRHENIMPISQVSIILSA